MKVFLSTCGILDGLPLMALNVVTGEAKLLSTTIADPDHQSWSPDGSRLAFTNGGCRSAQVDSSFYPAYMPDFTLGNITYQIHQEELPGGTVIQDYFVKSATTNDFDEVVKTLGIPILTIQFAPAEAQDCRTAAETVFATLHPAVQAPSQP